MKKQNLLTRTLLLLALIVGSTSVWADETTIALDKDAIVFEPEFGSDGTGYASTEFSLTSSAGTNYLGWTRTDVGCAKSRIQVKAKGSFTSPAVTSNAGYSIEITYSFSSESSASVSIIIGNDDITSTKAGTLKATTTSKNASFTISAGSKRAVYITKIEITPKEPDHVENVDDMLIDYPTTKDGITINNTSNITEADDAVKLKTNTTNTKGIKFGSSYMQSGALSDNYITFTTTGGFKKGDIVTIAGAFNNSSDEKLAKFDLFTTDGSTANVLFTTSQLINGRLVDDDPVEESYVLTEDIDELCIGRNGNTATIITLIKVGRPQAVNVLFTDATWTSFSSDRAVQAPEGVKVYYASASSAGTVTLTEIADRKIPANEGVVLNGSAGVKSLTVIEPVSALANNLLKPHVKESDAKAAEYYTLAVDGSKNPVFKKSSGAGTLAAGKSYLDLTTEARELAVTFGDATGVQELKNSRSEELKSYYNLAGQRVAQPQKGLYIVNGKKVVIK